MSETRLFLLEYLLENLMIKPHHDIRIHLDEAAVAVIGKAWIAGVGRQRLDGFVIEAEVEDRVHHARHRCARAGADGYQE